MSRLSKGLATDANLTRAIADRSLLRVWTFVELPDSTRFHHMGGPRQLVSIRCTARRERFRPSFGEAASQRDDRHIPSLATPFALQFDYLARMVRMSSCDRWRAGRVMPLPPRVLARLLTWTPDWLSVSGRLVVECPPGVGYLGGCPVGEP